MNSTIENVLITPEMAFELLSQTDMEYQRPLRKAHVDFLAKEMRQGSFLSNTIALCVNGTDKKYLVNGQHTLNAIFESGVSLTLPVQTFHVSSRDEIGAVYARIDKQVKRSRADTFRAYGVEEKLGLPYTAVNRFGACAFFIMNNFRNSHGNSPISDFDVIDFMMDWKQYAEQYYASIETSSTMRHTFERKEVFAVGLITHRYSSRAAEFWRYVTTDDGLRIGDPRKTLRIWLIESGLNGGGVAFTSKRRIVTVPESIRCIVNAWNAFIDGRELKLLRVINTTLPFTIKETPYKNIS